METTLVKLQDKQLVAQEQSSTTSKTLTPIQTEKTEQRDFVQHLIAVRDTPSPIIAPHNDDVTNKAKIDVADFSKDVSPKIFID